MNKKLPVLALGLLVLMVMGTRPVGAIYDPREVPNNRMGVHILDPSEIDRAAQLVNTSGGEWGYVTIPIRADDRDQEKWETFFRKAKELKVIPIIRLTSWFPGEYWHVPSDEELLFFANFLDQMPWPVENRYLVVFNEPNHIGEWGGSIAPEEYARKLKLTIKIFKEKNSDYFILPAAMDRAAPIGSTTTSANVYWNKVFEAEPELVQLIDGWNSHAYPNPAFGGSPYDKHDHSIISYRYELDMLERLGRSDLPIFITEVGWSRARRQDAQIAEFWRYAWNSVWTDEDLVSINVWILQAHDGPFKDFTLVEQNSEHTVIYETLAAIPKIKGQPVLKSYIEKAAVAGESTVATNSRDNQGDDETWWNIGSLWSSLKSVILSNRKSTQIEKPHIVIGDQTVIIEIADNDAERALGLGHRAYLAENRGMLFMYNEPNHYAFWMKETLIPLDIIWIENNRIVDMELNVPVEADPGNPTKTYPPDRPARWVLEVNGGWTQKHGVKVGDEVKLVR